MSAPNVPIARVGGRLLLVDPDDRLLLIHERLEFAGSHWLTPGGGVEPGERPVDAAVREVAEETGYDVQLASDAAPVLVTQRLWSWGATTFDQIDHFFAARVPAAFEPAPRGLTALERAALLGYRWWSEAELRASEETLLPSAIADALADLLRGSLGGALGGGPAGAA